jgi:diguanylate cyclase (GGDEF)-like protein
VGSAADELPQLRQLLADGRAAEALHVIDRLLATEQDPAGRADLLLRRLSAVVNLGRRAEYAPGLDAADAAIADDPDPERHGRLNALAAIIALHDNSLDRCVAHLVKGYRWLNAVARVDEDLAYAWHDLATAYSYAGFHGDAIAAIDQARRAAVSAGLSEWDYVNPAIQVRLAVWHDHHGDTDACLRVLRDAVDDLGEHLTQLRPIFRGSYGYGVARLAALGEPVNTNPWPLLEAAGQSLRARDLRLLGNVCLSIADGQATTALALLDQATINPATMGAPEPYRLRVLALVAAGQHAEALAAERRMYRVGSELVERTRDLFMDGVAARLDHEHMLVTVSRYKDEALTDPLTGLPNRRHLEQYVAAMIEARHSAILGVCDLDRFKAVNDEHGHLAGDTVLQRVAAVLARVMRRGDFVARYGGDEFVVVLPGASPREAREVAHRIVTAIDSEDWAALVPGTRVGITVGWAEATSRMSIADAFAAADRAMLRRKAS